ncbi:MAG: HpaII family restriction endonuclease [Thermoplasmatales archaeon]|nr:HpaII family restriction endonuclease [Thermoplasmatales archaeon]
MTIKKKSGNKGEWSEFYVFLRLLSDGEVFGADDMLNVNRDVHYHIKGIETASKGNPVEYIINKEKKMVYAKGVLHLDPLPQKEYAKEAERLLNEIRISTGTCSFDFAEKFMEKIGRVKLKASSAKKEDVRLILEDPRAGGTVKMGFSIKSHIGSPPTLLNPSKRTNFIFELHGANDETMKNANSFIRAAPAAYRAETHQGNSSDIRKMMDILKERGVEFSYAGMSNPIFRNNLMIIDSDLPEIVSKMLLIFYSGKGTDVTKICKIITEENPFGFDFSKKQPYYNLKIKKLLSSVATGMVPGTPWMGEEEANGGYLAVKEDGAIVCYNLYDRKDFEEYLFKNTKLDSPSTTRYDYGYVYKEDGRYMLKLCLQIRFKN